MAQKYAQTEEVDKVKFFCDVIILNIKCVKSQQKTKKTVQVPQHSVTFMICSVGRVVSLRWLHYLKLLLLLLLNEKNYEITLGGNRSLILFILFIFWVGTAYDVRGCMDKTLDQLYDLNQQTGINQGQNLR